MDKNRYLNNLKHNLKIDSLDKNQNLVLKAFNGVDDIYDNVAGVQLFIGQLKVITGVLIVETECEGYYIKVAHEVAEEFLTYLQSEGFTKIKIENSLKS